MRSLVVVSLIAIPLAIACTSGSSSPQQQPDQGVPEGNVVSPTTGLEVAVALSSVHLGAEGCTHDESMDPATKSCASNVLPDGGVATPRGTGPCGGPCDFSNLQISFTPGATGQTSHVKIDSAMLLDASTGAELQEMTTSTPLEWTGAQYSTWDETLAPSTALKASYTLSPPSWSTVDSTNSYSRQYKVRLVVEIDGATITLQSDALSRDPPVAT